MYCDWYSYPDGESTFLLSPLCVFEKLYRNYSVVVLKPYEQPFKTQHEQEMTKYDGKQEKKKRVSIHIELASKLTYNKIMTVSRKQCREEVEFFFKHKNKKIKK
jgi:hypothetical protein